MAQVQIAKDRCGRTRYAIYDPASGTPLKYSTYSCSDKNYTFIPEILPGECSKRELFKDEATNEEFIAAEVVEGADRRVQPPPYPYGFLTCTLSDQNQTDPILGLPGDGDCIDAFLMGGSNARVGYPVECTPRAAWAAVDDEEADWKIMVVPVDSLLPIAEDTAYREIERWLKTYKPGGIEVKGIITVPSLIEQIIGDSQANFNFRTAP